MQTIENEKSDLSNNKIFELLDTRFSKKFILYEHLHNSYNDLINQIINYIQSNDNFFDENRLGDLIYRYRFKFENLFVRPLTFLVNSDPTKYNSNRLHVDNIIASFIKLL